MSRVIKFRAWYKSTMITPNDEWGVDFEGQVVSFPWDSIEGAMVLNTDDFVKSKDVELMQFTGLQDRNGVDIYESDWLSNNLGADREVVREVRFTDGCWTMLRISGNSNLPKSISLHEFYNLNYLVVGNCHE